MPATPLGRVFRDALGRANQALAAAADEVYLLVVGLPLRIKPTPEPSSYGLEDRLRASVPESIPG